MFGKRIKNGIRKVVALSAIMATISTGITANAASITVTPVQASYLTKANTVVYATADLNTPTQCILPEDFPVTVTGISNTGFWEIEINGVKFYIVGDAVKTDTTGQTQTTAATTASAAQTTAPATVTVGMKNAVSTAKRYIKLTGFSRPGLIDQLEYEGYTEEESVYGADNCGADWNKECAETAQSYMKLMSFSRSGLIDQLKYEGYTDAQITYGLSAVGY